MTDPRFDPAFQRGYSGPAPELVVRDRHAVGAQAPRSSAPPPPLPQAPSRTGPPPQAVPLVDDTAADGTAVEGTVDGTAAEESELWRAPRRNPYSIALLVISVAMSITGGWLMQVWAVTSATGWSPAQQTAAIVQQQLAPVLLLGGIIGVVVWLVFGAFVALAPKARV